MIIKMTDQAREYLQKALKDRDAIGFIVNVTSGGCSGMQYKFDYAKDSYDDTEDETVDFVDFKVFIKKRAVLFTIGTTLDYETTNTGAKLIFKNPNETNRCGCGKSFNV